MKAELSERSRGLTNYIGGIRAAVRGLWVGAMDLSQFYNAMRTSLEVLRAAWYEGAAECGILPNELSAEERLELENMIVSQQQYVIPFGEAIISQSKERGGQLGPHLKRADLWVNRWYDVVNRAKLLACKDKKLAWRLNLKRVTKDHCEDCLKMDGRVYRSSTWKRWDVRPQSPALACGGWQCGCGFEVTDEPATPGRPPKLSGQ